jgi:hypothetical protein
MVSITVDGKLAESLDGANDPVEIVDAAGRRLGFFEPSHALPGEASPEFYANEPGLSKDELFRHLDDGRN